MELVAAAVCVIITFEVPFSYHRDISLFLLLKYAVL